MTFKDIFDYNAMTENGLKLDFQDLSILHYLKDHTIPKTEVMQNVIYHHRQRLFC